MPYIAATRPCWRSTQPSPRHPSRVTTSPSCTRQVALSTKQAELNAKLTELRRERRKLLCNEDIDEQVDTLRLTIDTIRNGPETLSSFDEALFTKLVERMVVDTQGTIRFQLYGGFEFQETLEA